MHNMEALQAVEEQIVDNGEAKKNFSSEESTSSAITIVTSTPQSSAHSVAQAAVVLGASASASGEATPHYSYIPEYRLYWNEAHRLYYDPSTQLFYQPDSQLYYRYDAGNSSYVPYHYHPSSADADAVPKSEEEALKKGLKSQQWSSRRMRRRAMRLFGVGGVERMGRDELDIAELLFDLVERCAFLDGETTTSSSSQASSSSRRRTTGQWRMGREYVDLDGCLEGEILGSASNLLQHSNDYSRLGPIRSREEGGEGSSEEDEEEYSERMELARRQIEEESAKHPPCIRLIEVSNNNMLHIVTIMGAKIGHGPKMDVQLHPPSSHGISTHAGRLVTSDTPLATISYLRKEEQNGEKARKGEGPGAYFFECVLQDDHTYSVDATLNHEPLESATPVAIRHGDQLSLRCGSKSHLFVVHIHKGSNTCQGCEQGLLTVASSTATHLSEEKKEAKRVSREAERLRNLRRMKREYGLLDGEGWGEGGGAYKDRAHLRRKLVGSEAALSSSSQYAHNVPTTTNPAGGIYTGCAAAPKPGASAATVELKSSSILLPQQRREEKPIEPANKGFQLLKGMGWKEGQGLGKAGEGIQSPVTSTLKQGRAGLGMEAERKSGKGGRISIRLAPSPLAAAGGCHNDPERVAILEKTRERYKLAEEAAAAAISSQNMSNRSDRR